MPARCRQLQGNGLTHETLSSHGRSLSPAHPANRGGLRRRLRPGLYRGGARGRRVADHRAVARGRVLRAGRGGDADLHQPEQSVDRDRRAAFGARHRRQFRARPRQRRRDHDDRPGDGARQDAAGADVAGRGRGRRDHRQGQAAPHARQRPRHSATPASASRPSRPTAAPRRARHRRRRGAGRPRQARHVFGRPVAVRARRRHPAASSRNAAQLLYLSLSDYVQHGHAPGRAGGTRFPPRRSTTASPASRSSAASSRSPPITA